MSDADFVVVLRNGQWSFTIDGEFYGPYQGQAGAEAAAISEAKHRGRIGETAQVSVDLPDDGAPVIFDTEK
jgi:hypothetical protein